ncbi:MAG: PfkB family carbohydrate kinase [Nibricoccus sp.]
MSAAATPHIYTLTGNLLAERTQDFAAWSPGKTQRATAQSFQVGGKGINVSKMLMRLGTPNTALCFPGGASGAECIAWLRYHHFTAHAFPAQKATRTGLVVRAAGQPETTFLGPDSPPDAVAFRTCADYLDALPDNAVLALCGSFPGWDTSDAEPLRAALERLLSRATVCADTYGPPLEWIVQRPVALVKINRDEFDRLFTDLQLNRPIQSRLVDAIVRWPVQRWIITDGPGEVSFVEQPAHSASPQSLRPPPVEEISATGSGDVLFACILHALLVEKLRLADAVAFALPFASANAASPGIADFAMNQVAQSRSSFTP